MSKAGEQLWDRTGVWALGNPGFCPCSDTSCLSEPAPVGDAGAEALPQ